MKTEKIIYEIQGKKYQGFLAYDETIQGTRPGVLVAPTWKGKDEFCHERAIDFAKLGYVGFAIDLFGDGKVAANDEEAFKLVSALFVDRQEIRTRMNGALDYIKKSALIDKNRTAAIGFCFGGMAVLELMRSGADFTAGVSFHGVLGTKLGNLQAKLVPSKPIRASALFLHGNDDPLVTHDDIISLEKELTDAKVDWQFNTYGNASHAFTNPGAHDQAKGMTYNKTVADRAYLAMRNFFAEKFGR